MRTSKPSMPSQSASSSMHDLVSYLLRNADDRSSADLETRRIWNEKKAELRQRDKKACRRFEGCLDKRASEVVENPDGFISFVIYGVENQAFPIAGLLLSNGTIVDEVYRKERPQFVVWRDGEHKFVNVFECNGISYVPIDDDLVRKGKILLPSSIEEYGNDENLHAEIVDFIDRYAEVENTKLRLCAVQKMVEWLYEKLPVLPILNPRGGSETGKTRLGNALWQVSFRGMRADGVLSLSSLFRNAERWHGTLYVNEADMEERGRSEDSESSRLVKFYNSRYERGAAVWRTNKETLEAEVFDSFGPTILVTRKGFRDDALESRCLVVPMMGRTRSDILLNLPPEFEEEGQRLRNRLEYFRLRNLNRFVNDFTLEFAGVSPRMNQILQPMASLSKTYIPGLYPEIASIAHDLSEQIVEQRANSEDGWIIRAYLAIDPLLAGKTSGDISESIKDLFNIEMKAVTVGRRARSLGFESFRGTSSDRSRFLRLSKALALRMLKKYVPEDEREGYAPSALKGEQGTLEQEYENSESRCITEPSVSVRTVRSSNTPKSEPDSSDSSGQLDDTQSETNQEARP